MPADGATLGQNLCTRSNIWIITIDLCCCVGAVGDAAAEGGGEGGGVL